MAQLPPKSPAMAQDWPSFPNCIPATDRPSSVDEFSDFTTARRGSHRRSMSDSIAFFDSPTIQEPHGTAVTENNYNNGNDDDNNKDYYVIHSVSCNDFRDISFDLSEDDQLVSLFSDNNWLTLPPKSPSPSTPPMDIENAESPIMFLNQQCHLVNPTLPSQEQRIVQPQLTAKTEPGDSENSCKQEPQETSPQPTNVDSKRVKRILANRQSAQRSRVRKLQYISELERSLTSLQAQVSTLSPRVAYMDQQRLLLNVDNSALKQRIAALGQDRIFKDAHQEALRKEIERLRKVYHEQNLNNTNNGGDDKVQELPKRELPNHEQ